MGITRTLTFLLVLPVVRIASAAELSPAQTEFFERKIRPLLVDHCYQCHSSKSEKIKGKLLLDSHDGLLKGGESKRPLIVISDPEKSLLLIAVRHTDPDLKMPPKQKLTDAQIADLAAWIKLARDPRTAARLADTNAANSDIEKIRATHWSFKPLQPPPVPIIGNPRSQIANPIDAFILSKLDSRNLSPPADRRTLLRRVTFDLTGLPPTPQELTDFLNDTSPTAFEKVIDRLLASSAYGERWGRHWLDVARYADTAGESADYPIPQAYLYRNYVINSFNADKPYDQFIREQIAGDLMESANDDQRKERLIATGFIALSRRFGVEPAGTMHLTIEDTLDTIGKSILGLSLSCARCHDHKFDPITSREYYGLYGFFSSTRYPYPGSEEQKRQKDLVPLISESEIEKIKAPFAVQLAAAEAEVKRTEAIREEVRKQTTPDPKRPTNVEALEMVRAARKKRDEVTAKIPTWPKAYAIVDAAETGNASIQRRGEPFQKGQVAPRAFLDILGGQKLSANTEGSGRLQLANWLTDPKNPLTARVIANRIWQYHFGQPLVPTPNDFGTRGQPPTHPELLDHLATKLIQNNWSIKSLHRYILTSRTYQQSSAADNGPLTSNYSSFSKRRLDAEEIRDAILAISGRLDRKPGGPHPFPPEKEWNWTQHNPFSAVYDSNLRSVYLMQQRIKRHPFFAAFDGPDTNASTAIRGESTTPLQALFLMNSPFLHEQSKHLANRLLPADISDKSNLLKIIDQAHQLCFARPATPDETASAQSYIQAYAAQSAGQSPITVVHTRAGLASYLQALLLSNEFFYLD